MKRKIYIISFVFLGILLSFLVHAFLEMYYIKLLVSNYSKYNLGLNFNNLVYIHNIISVLLFAAGILFGYKQGVYWWSVVYEKDGIRSFFQRFKRRK